MPVITVSSPLYSFRALVFLAAFGTVASISGCATYPPDEYSDVGHAWPPLSPGFGYDDLGTFRAGSERRARLDHLDQDFDHRVDADHRFHGRSMMGGPGHPGSFHQPPGGPHNLGSRPGFATGGEPTGRCMLEREASRPNCTKNLRGAASFSGSIFIGLCTGAVSFSSPAPDDV